MSYLHSTIGSSSSSSPASIKDRTNEFRSLVSSFTPDGRPRGGAPGAPARKPPQAGAKSEFAARAGAIAKDIQDTTTKLGRLAQLARRRTLFDDRPVEISELTYIIKHDIAAINRQLSELQAIQKAKKAASGGGKGKLAREEEHRANVVTLLQTSLAGTTNSFQEVLEVRTQNMKAQKTRTEQFAYSANGMGGPPGENSDSPLYMATASAAAARTAPGGGQTYQGVSQGVDDGYDPKGKGKAMTSNNAAGGDFLALDMGGRGAGQMGGGGGAQDYMQMQMMENGEDAYIQQRSTAIESIEATISELGSVFSQLAHMVAEQRDTVQRIDDNVHDVVDNVSGAQRELLKYYASVSNNRWLMFKIFGTLIIFFLVFILVS